MCSLSSYTKRFVISEWPRMGPSGHIDRVSDLIHDSKGSPSGTRTLRTLGGWTMVAPDTFDGSSQGSFWIILL